MMYIKALPLFTSLALGLALPNPAPAANAEAELVDRQITNTNGK
jgi:hypothetical protein